MPASIEIKALQLSIILLRQYQPALAKLLPGPAQYPTHNADVVLHLNADQVAEIIAALTTMGQQWFDENQTQQVDRNRNRLRQQCIGYLLQQWIAVGDHFQNNPQQQIH